MHVSQAFDIINSYKPNQVETLADLLPIELINSTYELTDTVTLRKRKLTLESKAWLLVLWRTEDSKDNAEALAKPTHKEGKETQYPQVCMVSQMELRCHLITGSAFYYHTVNEMKLAERFE